VPGLLAAGGPGVKKTATKRGAISQLGYDDDAIAPGSDRALQPPSVKKTPPNPTPTTKHVTESCHNVYILFHFRGSQHEFS